jgi:hypothetical protein
MFNYETGVTPLPWKIGLQILKKFSSISIRWLGEGAEPVTLQYNHWRSLTLRQGEEPFMPKRTFLEVYQQCWKKDATNWEEEPTFTPLNSDSEESVAVSNTLKRLPLDVRRQATQVFLAKTYALALEAAYSLALKKLKGTLEDEKDFKEMVRLVGEQEHRGRPALFNCLDFANNGALDRVVAGLVNEQMEERKNQSSRNLTEEG